MAASQFEIIRENADEEGAEDGHRSDAGEFTMRVGTGRAKRESEFSRNSHNIESLILHSNDRSSRPEHFTTFREDGQKRLSQAQPKEESKSKYVEVAQFATTDEIEKV